MFRRVLVVVDAVESARVAPYASYAAAAVAGVDPRERAKHARGEIPADRRAHVAWLPQSPPLAVRFILAARDDAGYAGDDRCLDASRTVVAAVVSRAPASTTVFEMPPLTTPQIARILAGASPAPVGAAEAKSHGALDRGHHRGEVMAEAIRAKCATPGHARAGRAVRGGGDVANETLGVGRRRRRRGGGVPRRGGGGDARAPQIGGAGAREPVERAGSVRRRARSSTRRRGSASTRRAPSRRVSRARDSGSRATNSKRRRRDACARNTPARNNTPKRDEKKGRRIRLPRKPRPRLRLPRKPRLARRSTRALARRSTKVSTRSSRRFDRGSRRGVRATRGRARWNPSTRTRTTTTRRVRKRNRVLSRSRRRSSTTPRPRKFKFRARFATRTRARRLWNDTRPHTRWIPSTASAFDDGSTRTSPRISYPFPITYA